MNGLLRRYCILPRFTLFPREIFRRDEEDRRRRCRGHRRGGLTKYPAERSAGRLESFVNYAGYVSRGVPESLPDVALARSGRDLKSPSREIGSCPRVVTR